MFVGRGTRGLILSSLIVIHVAGFAFKAHAPQPAVIGRRSSFFLATASAASCLIALLSPKMSSAVDGEKLFEANCAVCHAGGGNVIMRDKTLERADLERYGYDHEAIEQIIIRGLNAMPGFALDEKRRLSPDDILALTDYVEQQADAGWPVENP